MRQKNVDTTVYWVGQEEGKIDNHDNAAIYWQEERCDNDDDNHDDDAIINQRA